MHIDKHTRALCLYETRAHANTPPLSPPFSLTAALQRTNAVEVEADEPLWQPLNKTDAEGRAACQHQKTKERKKEGGRGKKKNCSAEKRRDVRAACPRRLGSGRPVRFFSALPPAAPPSRNWHFVAESWRHQRAGESWEGGVRAGVLDTSVDVDK